MPSRRTRDRTLLGLIAVVAALVLAGTAWAMFGQPGPDTPDPSPTAATATVPTQRPAPTPAPTAPATSSAGTMKPTSKQQEVALEAARIMTTWDTATDINDAAAEQRATHLMTKERAEKIIVGDGDSDNPIWDQVARHDATSTPELELVPTSGENTVRVVARWTWHAEDERPVDDPLRRSFAFSLTDDQDTPKITDYIWRDLN